MKAIRAGSVFVVVFTLVASAHVNAAAVTTLTPTGYTSTGVDLLNLFPDGTQNGSINIVGTGDLTDGVLPTVAWNNSAPASYVPWVGWDDFSSPYNSPATINFSFAGDHTYTQVTLVVHDGTAGGNIFLPVDVTFTSKLGGNTLGTETRTLTGGVGSPVTTFTLSNLDLHGDTLIVSLSRNAAQTPPNQHDYIFGGEVSFLGQLPEPMTAGLLGTGLLAMMRRRRGSR